MHRVSLCVSRKRHKTWNKYTTPAKQLALFLLFSMRWDIVTFSLGYGIDSHSIDSDIQHFQNINFPDCQEEILVVNDASEDVGSGGSALNALIRTAERLCYRNKFTVLTEAVLQDVNVLIVLVSDPRAILNSDGFSSGGNGYIFNTYLSNSIKNAAKIAEKARQKGVWIIGSDASWDLVPEVMFDLPEDSISGFSFAGEKSVFSEHGWCRTDKNGKLVGMEFDGEVSGTSQFLEKSVILGFIYLPPQIATSFLSLYSEYPVAATTYLGIDSNVTPLKLSIFFDFMLATCTSEPEFVSNQLGVRGKVSENIKDRTKARKQIYKKLRSYKGRVEVLDITNFKYKEFPESPQSYTSLIDEMHESLESRTDSDVERCLRSILSLQGVDSIVGIFSFLREQILKFDEKNQLQIIFTASLALSLASNGKGGLRNGPAKNAVFENLSLNEIFDEILKNWLSDPSKMIRAARHLETAGQKVIHRMVDDLCSSRTIKLEKSNNPKLLSALVTAPVRIDFFGGWLDTPPIFFGFSENAAVVNMAVQLDGKNPIRCHITKSTSPVIELCQDGSTILIESDKDLLHMHDKPSETGALVSACIVSLGFHSLAEFFEILQCTGLRIETRSELPHGSGLGTSSILACTILKAICALGKVSEEQFSLEDQIVHTVLRVEQIMTTGGGWQDQCGAMYGGLKKCFYQEGNGIRHQTIHLNPAIKNLLEERLLLVYTGKTRLAKNLLQEVIRNFFTCIDTKRKLRDMAETVDDFSERIEKGYVSVELLRKYHETKKFMTRFEPAIVTELLETLQRKSMIDVGWAAGAGGGGFLYLWLCDQYSPEYVKNFLKSQPQFSSMTCHRITIPLVPPVTLELN
ncbi:hypothetical protein L3Y34_017287 [Caenorhabditis briggsae]|uniref:GHMP kinase N-terminal domain-containing protein n=2 Tax=Caenorhabditis briggsae TaxID=6238 RepID=A0AAE9DH18_CAEBR|nr:hypothetical protein L3Y34_017287 [Caenorhabditis briggsae]